MNLTWHIIKKDLSRFWLGIAFLAGLTALKIFLILGIFSAEVTREWAGRMNRYQALLLVGQWILTFLVAVAVVQEDPVSEPGAFWETLPISRRQLLGAKFLDILLICALPALVTLALGWIVVGLPASLLGWPLTAVAEAQLGLCVIALAFGSLAKNSAQVIFWVIGVTLVLFIPAMFPELFNLNRQGLLTPAARFNHLFAVILAWGVTGIAVTLNQYLSQSRKRSVAILACGLGLSLVVLVTSYSGPTLLPGQQRLDREIAGLSAQITQAVIAKPSLESNATSLTKISLQRIDPLTVIYPLGAWSEPTTDHPQLGGKIYSSHENPARPLISRAVDFMPSSAPWSVDFGVESIIPAADVSRIAGRKASYDFQVVLDVRYFAIEGQSELVKGAVIRSRLGITKITSVTCDGAIMRVEIDGRDSGLTPEPGWFVGIDAEFMNLSNLGFALINPKTKTVLMPARTSSGIGATTYSIALIRAKLQFVLPPSNSPDVTIADWKLVKVSLGNRHRAFKSFTAEMTVKETPRIELDPAWLD
ncbi:MAG: hypothetical protein ABI222_13695 [Opitutaceae bacterium]